MDLYNALHFKREVCNVVVIKIVMKKGFFRGCVIVIAITGAFYVAGTIMGRSFKPFDWREDIRIGICCFWLILGIIGFSVGNLPDTDE